MPAPVDLNLVRAFAAVHEAGSFSGAATRLKQPRSSISRAVSALETSLGTVLFHRTTRRVATTAEGKLLFERIAPLLEGLDAALSDVPEQEEDAAGTLRLTSAVDIGSAVLADVVARFSARHPRIRVEVHLTSSVVDLVRDGFDAAVRITSGKLRGANLTARKLGALSGLSNEQTRTAPGRALSRRARRHATPASARRRRCARLVYSYSMRTISSSSSP